MELCTSSKECKRTSLDVQWLRPRLPMQGVQVRSLVGEQRSHMPRGQKKETQNIEQQQYCNKFNKVSKTSPQKKNVKACYLLQVTGYLPCKFP